MGGAKLGNYFKKSKPRSLKGALRFNWLATMSVIDTLMTFYFVSYKHLTEELNPLMKLLLDKDPIWFLMIKMVSIAFLYPLAHHSIESKDIKHLFYLVFVVYLLLTFIHLYNLAFYFVFIY